MTLIVDGTTGVTFNDSSLQGAAASPYVLKNRIINGAMEIDQRNAGASVTPVNGQFITDRFAYITTQSSKVTSQQSSVAPTGFTKSLLFTSSSAYSAAAGDLIAFTQAIEGFNIADLGWGTANAKTVTLSFQVRSSLTGTFGGCFRNEAGNRFYVFSYSIPVANTWTTISITIPGDTTGTWETNNSAGIRLYFNLGCGTTYSGTAGSWGTTAYYNVTGGVNLVGTNGATFYITGVQLEIGSTATPFERRMYGTELALCQRYYEKSYNVGVVPGTNTNVGRCNAGGTAAGLTTGFISGNRVYYKVQKRTNCTITVYDAVGTSGVCTRFYLGVADTNGQSISVADESENGWFPYSSGSANASGIGIHWVASSEL